MYSPIDPHICGESEEAPKGAEPVQQAENRTAKGTFAPGKSGNPGGRVARENKQLREKLQADGEAVLGVVLKAAKAGDLAACKLVLDRLVPALKPTAAPVQVDIPEQSGIAATARAFIHAAASGAMPADVAAQLVTAVASLARIVEIDDLAKRLDALEAFKNE
jgi:hypothetical protein